MDTREWFNIILPIRRTMKASNTSLTTQKYSIQEATFFSFSNHTLEGTILRNSQKVFV